jgi:hypothetical protein
MESGAYCKIEKEESIAKKALHALLLDTQRSEITEYHSYHHLAQLVELPLNPNLDCLRFFNAL